MEVYFDSGALVKLYVRESFSEEVIRFASATQQIPISPLHELEIRNALRAQFGRGIMHRHELEKALDAFDTDIKANRLKALSPDWAVIYSKAEELSQIHTRQILCRSLDILHVSSALCFSCKQFVTGDRRQAELAEKAELAVHPVGFAANG